MGGDDRSGRGVAAVDMPAVTPRDIEIFRILSSRSPVESELRGPSMGRALPDGTRIRITPPPPGEPLRLGQIVAFLAGSRVMVHRIAYLGRGAAARRHLITQGDGNWMCDPPIEAGAILGVVESRWVDGQWAPVPASGLAPLQRAVSWPTSILLRLALEASPALAGRLGRVMSYTRMSFRALWPG